MDEQREEVLGGTFCGGAKKVGTGQNLFEA